VEYDEDAYHYYEDGDLYDDDDGEAYEGEDDYADRLAAIEQYLAAGQDVPGGVPVSVEDAEWLAQAYEDEAAEAGLEEAFHASFQAIESQLGRDLTSIEMEALAEDAIDTGIDPADSYDELIPTDLTDDEDRAYTMAGYMDDAEEAQEAADAEEVGE
jgi:hypothetical protein